MAGGADAWPVRWSEELHDLDRLAGRSEFPLLVRLADDVANSLGATVLRVGDVLKLHGVKTFKKMLLTAASGDSGGRSTTVGGGAGGGADLLAMPLGYSARVRVLPMRSADHVYPTVGDLIKETPRPRAVVAHKRIVLPEKGYAIGAGDVLSVNCVDKRCTSAGVVDYLQCRHQEKTVGLPASCVGNFTALADETQYTVRELADAFELPLRLKFLPTGGDPGGGGGRSGPEEERADAPRSPYARSCAELAESEYVASGLQRRQYAVCTDSRSTTVAKTDWLYFVPVDCPRDGSAPAPVRVRLPLFHDLASYNAALGRFCANLSMKHVVDCAPVEKAATRDAYRCTLADGYDLIAPTLPRRKGSPAGCEPATTDTSDACRTSSSRCVETHDEKATGHQQVLISGLGARPGCSSSSDGLNCEPSTVAAASRLIDLGPAHTGNTYVRMPYSPTSRRRSSGAASTAAAAAALPGTQHQHQASSQPATPQASRQKKVKATARWKEKLAQSLSNLRLAGIGGGGSGRHGRPGKQHGEASTSPLERRLLTSGGSDRTSTSSAESSDSEDTPAAASAAATAAAAAQSSTGSLHSDNDSCRAGGSSSSVGQLPYQRGASPAAAAVGSECLYENVSSVLLGAGFGRPPSSRRPGPLTGWQQQQLPVKELWAPPCSPDYRDASTATLAAAENSSFDCYHPSGTTAGAVPTSTVPGPVPAAAAPLAGLPLPKQRQPIARVVAARPNPAAPNARSRSPGLLHSGSGGGPAAAAATGNASAAADRQSEVLPRLADRAAPAAGAWVAGDSSGSSDRTSSSDYHVYTSLVFPETTRRSASPAYQPVAEPSADGCAAATNGQCAHCSSTEQNGSSSSLSCSGQPLMWDDAALAPEVTASRGSPGIIRSLADVPDDLSTLSVIGLCACLRLYNMAAVAEKFLQQQVDGQFFVAMPEAMFKDRCFDLSEFEILKLKRLQNGWRPKMM